jgi:hypothetical protein
VKPEDRVAAGTPCRFEADIAKAKIFDVATGKRL